MSERIQLRQESDAAKDPFYLNNFLYQLKPEQQQIIKESIIASAKEGDIEKIQEIIQELDERSRGAKKIIETTQEQINEKEKSKPELLPEICPVFIHRWFEQGEGFAYNSLTNFQEALNCIDEVLKDSNREGEKGKKKFLNQGWIIYIMRPDYTTKNLKAKNRSPFYFTAAIYDGEEPTGEKLDEIYRQLENLPEVELKGLNADLIIGGK